MSKKKKIVIGSIIGVIIVVVILFSMGIGKNNKQDTLPENNIEFFTVADVDQVFINGMVTPVKSKEFIQDNSLGKLGKLQVKNGENVEEGTLLYQYTDEATSTQISELNFQIESTQAEKEKTRKQMLLEIDELNKASEQVEEGQDTGAPSRESIELKYDLGSFDIKIGQLQTQVNELNEKQVNQVTAPFSGQVIIPQEQNRDSAIMTLTSNDFYVEGDVNEKDLIKVKEKQPAEVKMIASNEVYQGEVIYVSNTPIQETPAAGAGGSSEGGLSKYIVKLSLKDTKNVKQGFHVQASIKLDKQKIEVPKSAVKEDKDKKQSYVLVDDFGTVLRKNITTTDKGATKDHVVVTSGLESLDKVIVKSDRELKNGEMLNAEGNTNESGTQMSEGE
ncbi:efflux RND transporter periplasmic adaptor subunit [Vagococcus jeotgali]|uniref:efflux RND transporter periplasmic adaptor subunit n=1 Tax=Vagococcus jeotgali TaxID=3109030 RepID=UPI002DD85104|nr:efflux RND transporter periplasmic adaptor subunit [Vagococcus sp. B2T-5]